MSPRVPSGLGVRPRNAVELPLSNALDEQRDAPGRRVPPPKRELRRRFVTAVQNLAEAGERLVEGSGAASGFAQKAGQAFKSLSIAVVPTGEGQ